MRLSGAQVKIRQIAYVNFETASQFLFNFFIILQFHYTQILCKFLTPAFSAFDKRISWKKQFWHFHMFWWKSAKFLMSFSKPQVGFSSNFAWIFIFMKDNSSVHFQGQTLYTLHGRDQLKWKFLRLLTARIKIHQILVIFFFKSASLFSIIRHDSYVLF